MSCPEAYEWVEYTTKYKKGGNFNSLCHQLQITIWSIGFFAVNIVIFMYTGRIIGSVAQSTDRDGYMWESVSVCVPFLITDWSRMFVPLVSSMVC